MEDFNTKWANRTTQLAVGVIRFYGSLPKNDETRIIGKQLIRSATSTAANFRAYCRGRSIRERYAKLCIVVEVADETLFWLEVLEDTRLSNKDILGPFKSGVLEIVKIMASTRKRLKSP